MFDVGRKANSILGIEIPQFKYPSTSLTKALEDYLNSPDFETNRQEFMSKKSEAQTNRASNLEKSPERQKDHKLIDLLASVDEPTANSERFVNNLHLPANSMDSNPTLAMGQSIIWNQQIAHHASSGLNVTNPPVFTGFPHQQSFNQTNPYSMPVYLGSSNQMMNSHDFDNGMSMGSRNLNSQQVQSGGQWQYNPFAPNVQQSSLGLDQFSFIPARESSSSQVQTFSNISPANVQSNQSVYHSQNYTLTSGPPMQQQLTNPFETRIPQALVMQQSGQKESFNPFSAR